MLKSGETVFLDNITVAEAEEQLRTKVTAVKPDGEEFIRKVLNV
jgi:NifB/MoaA-like Fe-S oxidoreductase